MTTTTTTTTTMAGMPAVGRQRHTTLCDPRMVFAVCLFSTILSVIYVLMTDIHHTSGPEATIQAANFDLRQQQQEDHQSGHHHQPGQQLHQQQRQQQQAQNPQEKPPAQPQDKHGEPSDVIQLRESRQRQESRVQQAEEYCSRKAKASQNQTQAKASKCLHISKRPPSKFCPIDKIASTFWTRFYIAMQNADEDSDTIGSPYDVPLSKVTAKSRCDSQNVTVTHGKKVVQAMFVREPFSRIFSAYVDKLVAPNPVYWRQWGKPAMKGAGVPHDIINCGENVTFPQFVQFTVKQLHLQNSHVIPMTQQCDPCRTHYDVIGKLETFPGDIGYMMSLLNISFQGDVDLSLGAKLDAIFDTVQGAIKWLKVVTECVSSQDIGRRAWRKLQIRGLVSSRIQYPLHDHDLRNVTQKQFYDVAVQAHHASRDKRLLRLQKDQAFMEAFRSVSLQDWQNFVRVYRDDFAAFGYDAEPLLLFHTQTNFTNTKAFDFNMPWTIPGNLL